MDEAAELFDLCDAEGRLTGEVKPRVEVHRDGDWHRAFHCWVLVSKAGAVPRLVLQRRSSRKLTWPGRWDVSVGGHYLTGEGVEGGLREIQEELGLNLSQADLLCLGRRREEVFHDNGLIEREIQDEYFVLQDLSLSDLRPDPREVDAVALAPASEFLAMVEGNRTTLRVEGGDVLEDGLVIPGRLTLVTERLVPRDGRYYARVVEAAQRLAAGDSRVEPETWW
jgi:isopentenyldiphosphate isomerase